MSLHNVKPTKQYPYKGLISPASVAAAGTATSGWVAVKQAKFAMASVIVGAGGGSVALKIEQATDGSGTSAKDCVTAAQLGITAQAAGGTSADADLSAYLDVDNSFTHIRLHATVTGGTGTIIGAALATGPAPYMS